VSLDYPFYEELKRRGHQAAAWWRIGDVLYYLGLIPTFLLSVASVSLVPACLFFSVPWVYLAWSIAGVALSYLVWVFGCLLKGHSYKLAKRDGVDINDY
jgi:hypothetical protein